TPSSRRLGPCARYSRASVFRRRSSPCSSSRPGPSSTASRREWKRSAILASVEAARPGTDERAQAAKTSGPVSATAPALLWLTGSKLLKAAACSGGVHLDHVAGPQLANALDDYRRAQVFARVDHQQQSDVLLGNIGSRRPGTLFARGERF